MHRNMVQKTKFYFIILAGIMTVSLLFLTIKWESISKVYKITNHETHLHIQQLSADEHIKLSPGRYSERQSVTKNNPGLISDKINNIVNQETERRKINSESEKDIQTNSASTIKGTAHNATVASLGKTRSSTEVLQTINKELKTFTNETGNSKGISHKNIKETKTIMESKPGPGDAETTEITKQITYSERKYEGEQNIENNTLTQISNKTEQSEAVNNNIKMVETKPFSHIGYNNKSEDYGQGYIGHPRGTNFTNSLLQSNAAQSNQKSNLLTKTNEEFHEAELSKNRPFHMQNKTSMTQNLTMDIINTNMVAAGTKGINNEEKRQQTEDTSSENTYNNLITKTPEPSSREDVSLSTKSPGREKSSGKGILIPEESHNFQAKIMNDSLVKEEVLISDNDANVNDRNTFLTKSEKENESKHNRDMAELEQSKIINGDSNPDKLKLTENTEKPVKLTTTETVSDGYGEKRRKLEERLKSIREQLLNRTIISDTKNPNSEPEKIDKKPEERHEIGPVNRYLQQRLRYLGLHNRFSNLNNKNNIEERLKHQGRTVRPDTCRGCFPIDFRRTINEKDTCEGSETDILILISTSPQNREARDAIRQTWGKVCRGGNLNSKIKCLFVLGNASDDYLNTQLKNESQQNHDMIQIDFKDSYANLTYKTMTGLKWSYEYCSNAKFVMKTDDDMYLNTELLPLLIEWLPKHNFLGGFCWGPSQPHRDTNSKWYVSYEMFRGNYYPSMCSGTGYILSSNIIPKILVASRNIPFFYLEDVYLAICLNKIGLHPTSINGFNNQFTPYNRCEYKNKVITSHQIEPESLKYYWSDSRLCEESRSRDMAFHMTDL